MYKKYCRHSVKGPTATFRYWTAGWAFSLSPKKKMNERNEFEKKTKFFCFFFIKIKNLEEWAWWWGFIENAYEFSIVIFECYIRSAILDNFQWMLNVDIRWKIKHVVFQLGYTYIILLRINEYRIWVSFLFARGLNLKLL